MTPKTLDKYIAALKKKAAAEGWSKTEYDMELNKIYDEMADQYSSGKITYSEIMGVQKKIMNAMKNMSLQGGTAPAAKTAPAAAQTTAKPAAPGMTHDEYIGLWESLNKKKKVGLITDAEYYTIGAALDQHFKDKTPLAEVMKDLSLDPGNDATLEAQAKIGKKVRQIYGQAVKEMQATLTQMTSEYGDLYQEKLADLHSGKITQAEFDEWAEQQVQRLEIWRAKIDQCTGVMLNANQKALGMINGEMLGVFAENANFQAYQLTQDAGMNLSFAIYDEHTAEMLIRDNPELLPRRMDVNGKKDKAWNRSKIAGAVTQALIQGESIPKLAKRVAMQTGETNMKAMVRYARTAMTGAQNKGRIAMLQRAKGMGILVKKVWLATLDSRTRDSHQHMDGVTAEVDEKFVTPLGSKMECPGDMNGKPGDVWNCRCTLTYEYDGFPNDPADNERIQYDEYTTTETDADGKEKKVRHRESSVIKDMTYDEWKTVKTAGKMNDLNLAKVTLSDAQKAVIKAKVKEDKVYPGIWKDDVTLADYPAKKASIQAKNDYYISEIEKLKQAQASGAGWATQDKIDALVEKQRLLAEFAQHGELLEKRNAALQAVQQIYDEAGFSGTASVPAQMAEVVQTGKLSMASAGEKKTQFDPDSWDESRRKGARLFARRTDADKQLRPELDEEWDSLEGSEKYATWEYTHNSNPMNKPLSGYHEQWDRSRFVGIQDSNWGVEDGWRSLPGEFRAFGENGRMSYHKVITDLTTAIEKTPFKRDRWLVRGSDNGGLAGMMEGAGMDYNTMLSLLNSGNANAIRSALIGKKAINHAFTSTGIATDAGFDGNVKYRIFCPRGTKGIYAEPQSFYGHTISGAELYTRGQAYSSVGREAEVILQRGTTYMIRDVKVRGRNIEVEMDVVEQPDYFVHGDEDTINGGKTRHKKKK